MRLGARERKRKAVEMNMDVGITFKWIPGSFFPGENTLEKQNSEEKG